MVGFLFFADDWGRHPSSAQYLARELARRHCVLWVNTIGMRRPKLDLYTVTRGLEKIRQWFRLCSWKSDSKLQLHVLNPVLFPDWRSKAIQRINASSIAFLVRKYSIRYRKALIGVTALPLPREWLNTVPVYAWVYYCVDKFSDWPGLDGETLRVCECATIAQARLTIAASTRLQEHVTKHGKACKLLTHGIDLETWLDNNPGQLENCPLNLKKPAAVWWGLLDERIDWSWLFYAASQLPDIHFVLIGPTRCKPPAVNQYSNISFLGAVPVIWLPAVARQSDVLLMPYAENEVTRAMQPLKLLEYLATGKPIVARRLPALERWRDFATLCDTREAFVAGISSAVRERLSVNQIEERMHLLRSESWKAKAQQFLSWLQEAGLVPANDTESARLCL